MWPIGENTSLAPCHNRTGLSTSVGSKPHGATNDSTSSTHPSPDVFTPSAKMELSRPRIPKSAASRRPDSGSSGRWKGRWALGPWRIIAACTSSRAVTAVGAASAVR